jgi:RimJ/RimL family protein N-acetyltransferase
MDLDPEVYPYSEIGGRVRTAPRDPIKLRQAIRSEIASETPQFGALWVIEWKHQPGFLGLVGLLPCPEPKSIALLFRLIRSAWGQGIATEAARAALEYGFCTMKLVDIVALVHPENSRSQRVVQKIGLRWDGLVLVRQRSILSTPLAISKDGSIPRTLSYTNKFICYRVGRAEYHSAAK